MKFWLTVVVGVVVVTGVGTVLFVSTPNMQTFAEVDAQSGEPSSPEGLPKTVVEKTSDEVGKVAQMHEGESEFVIRNGGAAPLTLKPSKPSCTCAAVTVETAGDQGERQFIKLTSVDGTPPKWLTERSSDDLAFVSLAPGKSARIIVQWDSKQRVGKYSVHAVIRTNDPLKKSVAFTVKLDVERDIEIKPPTLRLGNVTEGKETQRTVYIFSSVHENLELAKTRFSSKTFTVATEPLVPEELKELDAKSGVKVHVTFSGRMPIGYFREAFRFESSTEPGKERLIPIEGHLAGRITLSPRGVRFGVVARGAKHERQVQIFAKGMAEGEQLVIGSIEPEFLEAKIVKDDRLKIRWLLTVTTPVDAPAGLFKGAISISDQDGVKRINLPVNGTISNTTRTASAKAAN